MEIPGLLHEEDVSLVLCNEGEDELHGTCVCVCVCEDKLSAFFQSFLLKNKYTMARFTSSLRGKDDLWDCMGKHCFLTLKIR